MSSNIKSVNLDDIDKILYLNLIGDTIGDSLLITPLFDVIKNNLPASYLEITCSPKTASLFKHPHLDSLKVVSELSVISGKYNKFIKSLYYIKMIMLLRDYINKKKFDLVFVGLPNYFLSQVIPIKNNVRYTVGYKYKNSIFSRFLTRTIYYKDEKEYPKRHHLKSLLDLLDIIGMEYNFSDLYEYRYVEKEELIKTRAILKEFGIKRKKFICIQAGAKWPSKQWPKEKFVELIREVRKERDYPFILLGGKNERELNDWIKNELKDEEVYNFSGLSISECAGLLYDCKCLIGNDSGLIHLAAAVGTDTITIYGSTSVERHKPLSRAKVLSVYEGKKPYITYGKYSKEGIVLMKKVKVETVLNAVREIW